ncbi:MAG: permease, partial [Planctomycetota bacterium]
ILTSLLWAWMLAAGIDRRLKAAATVMAVACGMTMFGLIHSPLPGNQLFLPFGPAGWNDIVLPAGLRATVFEFAAGYGAAAALLFAWSYRDVGEAIPNESP